MPIQFTADAERQGEGCSHACARAFSVTCLPSADGRGRVEQCGTAALACSESLFSGVSPHWPTLAMTSASRSMIRLAPPLPHPPLSPMWGRQTHGLPSIPGVYSKRIPPEKKARWKIRFQRTTSGCAGRSLLLTLRAKARAEGVVASQTRACVCICICIYIYIYTYQHGTR